jgi:iron complex transport system permease protein
MTRPAGFAVLRAGRGSFLLHRRAALVAALLGVPFLIALVRRKAVVAA